MRTRPSLLIALASATAAVAVASPAGASPTGASPAGASRGHAAKLAPPVIHESFTPLPCNGAPNHRTTLQLEGCAEQQILRSDKKIDGLNQAIFGKLFDDRARRDLITGHKAWLAYRHAFCQSESDAFEGGTEAGVLFAICEGSVNSEHVKDLNTFLADLSGNAG
jgi:uncharacterized protein YecT (DUF1311 family)